MHYFEFAQKDATVYEASATQSANTGLDEILEIRKDMNEAGTVVNVSRVLIKFDLSYISASLVSGLIPSSTRYYLNLYDANPKELTTSDTLYAYPVSQSWTMGGGRRYDQPLTTEGVSWRYKTGESAGDQWVSGSNNTGGTWFSGSSSNYGLESSQSFDHETTDMRMDVTHVVSNWIYSASAYPNEGFIVKRSGSIGNLNASASEGSKNRLGHFSFFSRDTNTIYPPKLEAMWDDSKWSTGSLSPLTGSALEEDLFLYMRALKPEYKEDSKAKFRVFGRERYPQKTYSTTSQNLSVKYLPSGSCAYSIRDALSEDVIVPFGTGSKLSCDDSGNYFNMWFNGYQPERYYRILFRVQSGSGTVSEVDQYFDEDFEFKVVR